MAAFDGGVITSDAGVLLLGAADRVIGLVARLARCFIDRRLRKAVEHDVETLDMQRVVRLALGYDELNDPTRCATILASSPRATSAARRPPGE